MDSGTKATNLCYVLWEFRPGCVILNIFFCSIRFYTYGFESCGLRGEFINLLLHLEFGNWSFDLIYYPVLNCLAANFIIIKNGDLYCL
jgi:hypothetical protein